MVFIDSVIVTTYISRCKYGNQGLKSVSLGPFVGIYLMKLVYFGHLYKQSTKLISTLWLSFFTPRFPSRPVIPNQPKWKYWHSIVLHWQLRQQISKVWNCNIFLERKKHIARWGYFYPQILLLWTCSLVWQNICYPPLWHTACSLSPKL